MNKEETIRAIKVMQAYVDGKHIQVREVRPAFDWAEVLDMSSISWDWSVFEYRIAPRPKKRLALAAYKDRSGYWITTARYYESLEQAKNSRPEDNVIWPASEFIEVSE